MESLDAPKWRHANEDGSVSAQRKQDVATDATQRCATGAKSYQASGFIGSNVMPMARSFAGKLDGLPRATNNAMELITTNVRWGH